MSSHRIRIQADVRTPRVRVFAQALGWLGLLALTSCVGDGSSSAISAPGEGSQSAAGRASIGGRFGAERGGSGATASAGGAVSRAGAATSGGVASEPRGTSGGATSAGGTRSSGGATTAGGTESSGGADGSTVPNGMCRLELSCPERIVDEPKRPCTLRIDDGAGMTLFMDHAGVELRGRTSLRYQKKNYGIELRTAAGVESPVPMLGMGKESDWILDGSWVDRSFMRNDLVFRLFSGLGHYAPESRPCTLSLDGENQGIYRLSEKIKRDDDRVTLPLDDGSGTSFLIQQDDEGNRDFPVGTAFGSSIWELVYPKQATATSTQVAAVQAWLEGLRAALNSADAGDPATGVFSYLDLENTADFLLLQEFSKNVDAYSLRLTLFKAPGRPAKFVPWDFDLSFGQPTVRGSDTPHEASKDWIENRTDFVAALTKIPALSARLGPRWRELRSGPFAEAAILTRLDQLRSGFDSAALAENFAIWPLNEVDLTTVYDPFSLYRVNSYDEELEHLRTWITSRLAWLDAHIDNYPN